MIKLGDTTKKTFYFLLIFSIIIIGNITFKFLVNLESSSINNFDYVLVILFTYLFKVTAGFYELYLRRSFRTKIKQPSKLQLKDYLIYVLLIILELMNVFIQLFSKIMNLKKLKEDTNNSNNYFLYLYYYSVLSNSQLLIISFLSFFILHYKFGKHKITGLIITILSVIFPIFIDLLTNEKKPAFTSVLITLSSYFIEGVIDVLVKYLLSIKYQSPYWILFLTGSFQCLLCVVFLCISSKESGDPSTWLTSTIIFSILRIISKGVIYYINIFINYKYTPAHKIVSNSFAFCFLFSGFLILIRNETLQIGLAVFGFAVCFIGSLIYNEIIVISVWDLDKDTIDEINYRAKIETNQLMDSLAETNLELNEEKEEDDNDNPPQES